MAPARGGWRECEPALDPVRPAGEPAAPEERAPRDLPGPTARAACASPADAESVAARRGPRAEAPGIDPAGPLTARGDGAQRIRNAAARQFPAAPQAPDVSHAAQHPAAAAGAPHGEGPAAAGKRADAGRRAPLADGGPGRLDHVGATAAAGRTTAGQVAVAEPIAYFAEPTDRAGYSGRLRSGRSIGRGAIEGLARRLGRRLKAPGRGWCAEDLAGMAARIATVATPEWDSLWTRPAA